MAEDAQLLPRVLLAFRAACDTLARGKSPPELTRFYLHLSARCIILSNIHDEAPEAFCVALTGTQMAKNLLQSLDRIVDDSEMTKTDMCETCKVPHGYGARLCIETYRAHNYLDECDFNMFLGLNQMWQEARIRSVTKSMVKFVLDAAPESEPRKSRKARRRRKAETRVKFLSWKTPSEPSTFLIDKSEEAISLAEFIAERPHILNGKTKRILAVLLGYAVLHFYGTGWIQATLCSEDILFFKANGAVPLKPYLQLRPRSSSQSPCMGAAECEDSEPDPDDDLFYHPYPCLVNLALMLMELHKARPLEAIALEHQLETSPDMSDEDRFLVAGQIFDACRQDFEDQTSLAINACLDVTIGCNGDDGEPDEDSLRCAIYENIVRRLEDELEQGYSYISVEGLDALAQTLDLTSDDIGEEARKPNPKLSPGNPIESCAEGCPTGHRVSFFEDQRNPDLASKPRRDAYISWRQSVHHVYNRFLPNTLKTHRVTIAVLDSGIDRDHLDFQTCDGRLKGMASYVDQEGGRCSNAIGHGTHTASLVLNYAPSADIYIVKIAENGPVPSSTIAAWKPDIISMSFGWPARDAEYDQLEAALKNARFHDVLVFAAASNDGANAKRAWPARHQDVICVHSTAADGTPSPLNPVATAGDNFATIGEAVEGAWPPRLCDMTTNQGCVSYRSGTSYATPILAGIAAFLLQYARENLPAKYAKRLKQLDGMTTVLRQISVSKLGYNYIAPRLHPDNFFGKGEEYLKTNLKEALS
ncbi:peptidyl-prolyl cis-trans isomerase ppi1 [Purpureocillium lavendulum]|uniref:Peptidyl-prolyl cis-trans isomerase ppi1 n=1 Tax=Purpureocillium lavendulum TaxID=1247861 RepID=A0AB34FXZ0_9HYPO|nr:peptidyl-prolyl cis-trans isomerase ppi1 [Purpureocillium lavendulum]